MQVLANFTRNREFFKILHKNVFFCSLSILNLTSFHDVHTTLVPLIASLMPHGPWFYEGVLGFQGPRNIQDILLPLLMPYTNQTTRVCGQ